MIVVDLGEGSGNEKDSVTTIDAIPATTAITTTESDIFLSRERIDSEEKLKNYSVKHQASTCECLFKISVIVLILYVSK